MNTRGSIVALSALVAAAFLGGVPLVATADTPATQPVPIALQSCSLSISRSGPVAWVSFVNRSPVVANRVGIRVLVGDVPYEVTDVGKFSPDIDIKHALRLDGTTSLPLANPTSCSVLCAHFTDGSAWNL